ncbi:MAG TPA: hypothetical protein VEJ42_10765 [Streptosporangiaceae bacterium]|nr:hypothetical protein [Streptosporangiaceae bacterium]
MRTAAVWEGSVLLIVPWVAFGASLAVLCLWLHTGRRRPRR